VLDEAVTDEASVDEYEDGVAVEFLDFRLGDEAMEAHLAGIGGGFAVILFTIIIIFFFAAATAEAAAGPRDLVSVRRRPGSAGREFLCRRTW